jgi:hypothetical protein
MSPWKSLAGFMSLVILANTAQAQPYTLNEKSLKDSYYHIQLDTSLKGELHIEQGDKTQTLKQSVAAQHQFNERVLETGNLGVLVKTARVYKDARVTMEIENKRSERGIRPQRHLMVAQRTQNGLVTFSPNGSLTREELDVTQHFDTLAIPGLLPDKAVAVGDTWKLNNAAAQAACYFEGLTANELTGKLVEVKNDLASVSITGTASGIDLGATVKLKINATLQFDLKASRIVTLEWSQQDERDQGPVSPKIKSDLLVKMTRTPLEPVNELSDIALVPVPQTPQPPETMTALSYSDPKARYNLTLARDWITVARTDDHLVMRYLERGEFVAQATVTAWPKSEPGKHVTGEEFEKAMTESPGWEVEELTDSKAVEADKGYFVYRVTASGKLNGVKTLQYFYLVAGPNGEQAVVAFAMTPGQVQKLGTRDLALVRSLIFPDSPKTQAISVSP